MLVLFITLDTSLFEFVPVTGYPRGFPAHQPSPGRFFYP